jgi:N-acylneuraminate cytidylyltransferase
MAQRIAIIPARGGSKRIPDKNIRDFCGKPMISYILDTAKKSELFDVIHVSTDSERIAETVTKLGFSVDFMRPANLADDHTTIMPVLRYVVDTYHKRDVDFEEVSLLMACAPLIEAKDLVGAAKLLQVHNCQKAVLGVAPYSAPIEWAFERHPDGTLVPLQPGTFSVRSQDIEDKYFDAGMFCFFPIRSILESEGAGRDDGFIGQVLPKYKAIDIDQPEDWLLAEAIFMGLDGVKNNK